MLCFALRRFTFSQRSKLPRLAPQVVATRRHLRLLTQDENGNFVPETFEDTDPPPPYAILSHTWLPDDSKEVKLQDLQAGRADHKPGYDKIRFCAKQAAKDDLKYFWIDTCSVDQTNSAELTEAINSMFRWYRGSTRCYVYLADVTDSTPNKRMLHGSRWFTRGWTLQELIAPKVVEFFAADHSRLGDRSSLETSITEATGMTIGALRGYPLSDFSIEERFRWAANRQTKKPEDKAYSLLGIFDVSMPAIYGEGEEKAMRRLREQIDRQRRPYIGATGLSLSYPSLAHGRAGSTEQSYSSASTTNRTPAYYLPFSQNRRFVGRQHELQELRQKLLIDKECQKIAIVGLGGIGKTQIALEFAHSVKKEKLDYSIFWMPAVSLESFEQACREIAKILQIPQEAATKQDVKVLVKQYLSDQLAGKWLLIVDNADDMDVMFGTGSSSGVVNFLPEHDDGITIFTSRRREVAESLASKNMLHVGKMSEEEAVRFMTASLIQKSQIDDSPVKQLIADLDGIPLAMAQAAANINTNMITVLEYLDLIRNTDADLVAMMSREVCKQSNNAIATTWIVSFEQILRENSDAAALLSFISCIEWKGIPLSLLPEPHTEARMTIAIGMLCSYGFLTRREYGDVYDMHRLVHMAIRIWLARENREAEVRAAALKHIVNVFPFGGYENRELWRAYLPHASRLMGSKDNANAAAIAELALRMGVCLKDDEHSSEAVVLLEQSCEWREKNLSENDSERLASHYELAQAYEANGQIEEAVTRLEYVAAVQEEKLAADQADQWALQDKLALAYHANGQMEEAVKLLEHVVAVKEVKLAEHDPSTLRSQQLLARSYQANGQIKEASKLLKYVVKAREKLAEEEPDQIGSQHLLAIAYRANGQIEEAVKLQEHVVNVYKKLAEDHPNRLASQYTLAQAYRENGQIKEAVTLLEHVVKVQEKLAENHPSRLKSQHLLAVAYQANGQIEEAVALLQNVVKVREKLAEDHPD